MQLSEVLLLAAWAAETAIRTGWSGGTSQRPLPREGEGFSLCGFRRLALRIFFAVCPTSSLKLRGVAKKTI